ncbi:MAG: cyclic nucleotide-binding domain-containing protein, partial [Rhodospirillales bacterium]|nr:cyclic nucleotide-binding domain-containing protein [Rhodospirillales bacterium]
MLFEKEDVTRMSLKQGEMVFKQNAEGDGIYIVEHGAINIVKLVDGEQVNLAILRDGEMFGEMAVIDGSKRMASAIALKNSTVI